MKPIYLVPALLATAWAQSAPEPLTAWAHYKVLQRPAGASGLLDFVLDRDALGHSSAGQADLRLYDSTGREIPYVLRVRHEVEESSQFTSSQFNRAVEGGAAVVSCDLGAQPAEHNVVEIDTAGANFRRLADVQGSPDGVTWSTLAQNAILFRFSAGGRSVEQSEIPYPVSRFRYLRVRVNHDAQVEASAPAITALRVRRSFRVQGELVPFPAVSEGRDADRMDGRPVSVWRIDLGAPIPFERLALSVDAEPAFSRPFQLEIVDDPAEPVLVASGELTHRAGATDGVRMDFQERTGRHLKLTVVDDRNPPLAIGQFTAMSAARQVVYEAQSAAPGPIRLYYGNPKALAPHYDLGARIDANTPAMRIMPGPEMANPVYRPEPKPLSERSPWLIYAVLAAASLALAAILLNLAKVASNRTAQAPSE